ncbi:MAG: hypothetical protein J6U20_10195 [Fibrobacter sp.]|nr:hypothetical protein [Fibrobacter sp.]
MSELKAYTSVDIEEMDNAKLYRDNRLQCTRVYLKSEADKVIAEKDARIAELKKERDWLAKDRAQAYDDLEKRAQLNIKQEESIRHQKYKRCLAMARWCRECSWSKCVENVDFYYKWYNRWLELAEKFKPNKE